MTNIMCELKNCKWNKGHSCVIDHIDLNVVYSHITASTPDIGIDQEWRKGYYCKRDHHLYCYNYSPEGK